jgi:hypothetical protein
VASQIRHRGAPEVVLEGVAEGVERQDVLVESDRGDVVVHEVPVEAVEVARHGDGAHQAVHRPRAGSFLPLGWSARRGGGASPLHIAAISVTVFIT